MYTAGRRQVGTQDVGAGGGAMTQARQRGARTGTATNVRRRTRDTQGDPARPATSSAPAAPRKGAATTPTGGSKPAPAAMPAAHRAASSGTVATQGTRQLHAGRSWHAPALAGVRGRLRAWDTPWSRLALHAAGIWLATRLAYLALTFFAVAFSSPDKTIPVLGHLLQPWERLDTTWYVNISRYGYWAPSAATFARDGGQMPTAFFPLYPALIKVTSQLLGDTQRTFSALLVANLGTLLAFVGMAFFAANEDGIASGTRALRLAAAYPLAFFLAAGYTDGLSFGLAVFALFFARRGWWYPAALCTFVAALTRITALALILPLAWEYARQQGWWSALTSLVRRAAAWVRRSTSSRGVERRPSAPASAPSATDAPPLAAQILYALRIALVGALVVGAAPLGLGLYMRYLGLTFHDPLSFVHAAAAGWYHVALPPWKSIPLGLHLFFTQPPWSYTQAQIVLDLGAFFVFAALTILAARQLPFAFTLYMAGQLYLAIASPTIFTGNANIFSSAGRYLIPSAPIFLVLSRWTARRPALESFLVDGGFLMQAALATLWLAIAAYIV